MALDAGRLVLASANPGKLRELGHLLDPLGVEVLSQADFDVEPVEETLLLEVGRDAHVGERTRELGRCTIDPHEATDEGRTG